MSTIPLSFRSWLFESVNPFVHGPDLSLSLSAYCCLSQWIFCSWATCDCFLFVGEMFTFGHMQLPERLKLYNSQSSSSSPCSLSSDEGKELLNIHLNIVCVFDFHCKILMCIKMSGCQKMAWSLFNVIFISTEAKSGLWSFVKERVNAMYDWR